MIIPLYYLHADDWYTNAFHSNLRTKTMQEEVDKTFKSFID
jgi:hypothetical protein